MGGEKYFAVPFRMLLTYCTDQDGLKLNKPSYADVYCHKCKWTKNFHDVKPIPNLEKGLQKCIFNIKHAMDLWWYYTEHMPADKLLLFIVHKGMSRICFISVVITILPMT